MKLIRLPLSQQSALDWTLELQQFWNNGDKQKVLDLFCAKSLWINTNQVLRGSEQINACLDSIRFRRLHHCLRLSLWAFSCDRLALEVESEWQSRDNGLWHRGLSLAHIQLNSEGLISVLKLVASKQPIETEKRKLQQGNGGKHDL